MKRPDHPGFRERIADLITAEFLIAFCLIAFFAVAFFRFPSREMIGALIAGFAGGWGYFLGNANGQRRAQDQAIDATAITGVAARALSAALSERSALNSTQEQAQ